MNDYADFLKKQTVGNVFCEVHEPATIGSPSYSYLRVDKVLKTKLVCTKMDVVQGQLIPKESAKGVVPFERKSRGPWISADKYTYYAIDDPELKTVLSAIRLGRRQRQCLTFLRELNSNQLTPEFMDAVMKLKKDLTPKTPAQNSQSSLDER